MPPPHPTGWHACWHGPTPGATCSRARSGAARLALVGLVAALASVTIDALGGSRCRRANGCCDDAPGRYLRVAVRVPRDHPRDCRARQCLRAARNRERRLADDRADRARADACPPAAGVIEAARAMGVPAWRILTHHILPNVAGPVIAYATLTVPQMILYESFLSFSASAWGALASLGSLVSDGARHEVAPWLLLAPAICLVPSLLLNLVGDGLRCADPAPVLELAARGAFREQWRRDRRGRRHAHRIARRCVASSVNRAGKAALLAPFRLSHRAPWSAATLRRGPGPPPRRARARSHPQQPGRVRVRD